MIQRTSVDLTSLPAALLVTVKAHCRVEFTRDDALLTTYTQAAIRTVESKCNVSLNPATYELTAVELRPVGLRCGARLPFNNVREFTVTADGTDVSADYELSSADFGGNASSYLFPVAVLVPPPAILALDTRLTLAVGVDDSTKLAPYFLSIILRLAGALYENREASGDLWSDTFANELMGMWRPDA